MTFGISVFDSRHDTQVERVMFAKALELCRDLRRTFDEDIVIDAGAFSSSEIVHDSIIDITDLDEVADFLDVLEINYTLIDNELMGKSNYHYKFKPGKRGYSNPAFGDRTMLRLVMSEHMPYVICGNVTVPFMVAGNKCFSNMEKFALAVSFIHNNFSKFQELVGTTEDEWLDEMGIQKFGLYYRFPGHTLTTELTIDGFGYFALVPVYHVFYESMYDNDFPARQFLLNECSDSLSDISAARKLLNNKLKLKQLYCDLTETYSRQKSIMCQIDEQEALIEVMQMMHDDDSSEVPELDAQLEKYRAQLHGEKMRSEVEEADANQLQMYKFAFENFKSIATKLQEAQDAFDEDYANYLVEATRWKAQQESKFSKYQTIIENYEAIQETNMDLHAENYQLREEIARLKAQLAKPDEIKEDVHDGSGDEKRDEENVESEADASLLLGDVVFDDSTEGEEN